MSDDQLSSLFRLPEQQHYFLTHSIGLMPRTNKEALQASFLSPWESGVEDIWPQWLNAINDFNTALAELLNSSAEQFCPQSNVSSGLTKVISSLAPSKTKKIIVATESDFPSAGFVLKQAEKLGFTLKMIPKSEDLQSLDTWENALSDDVHTAFITQVHYNTNTLVPVESITKLCRARNIISIVDSAQATGIVPIDLSNSNIDVMVGSCIKWLCGGPGAGFVWLNQSVQSALEPIDVGWFSHQNPFEFDINNFEYANTAARFWGGTPSVAAYSMASNSIRTINKIGLNTIQTHNRKLTHLLLEAVPERAIVSPIDLDKKGGTCVLQFDDQEAVTQTMRDNGILFDARQYGLRVSPHIYNTEADIKALIECF